MAIEQDVERNETTSLLAQSHVNNGAISSGPSVTPSASSKGDRQALVWTVLPTLLLGLFIAQADSSIVLATSQEIASEFKALAEASWLITTYTLAQCACQPLYGKTSDIFGRKAALIFAYIVFTVGCAICGIGTQYWQVLVGRAISGIGGAGMVGLVAVVVADLLPPIQVATWRSYVNVIATLGRSCGGPTGGWLVDTVGWRWCFLLQCPLAGLALFLIIWRLPDNLNHETSGDKQHLTQKLARIDWAGIAVIPSALVTAFLALDFAGKFYPMVFVAPLALAAIFLMVVFYYIEKFHAKEPIISIELIARRDVWVPYVLIALQTAAQFILTYTIPIYFQVVAELSVAAAGSRIVFIVVGNTVGGLLTGFIVSRTGGYKVLTVVATMLGITCYTLVLVRWHGASHWLDSLYLVLGGLGMGITQNTTFVHLTATLEAKDMAIAGTTWFLCQSIGMLLAVNVFNVVHHISLVAALETALRGVPNRKQVIQGASSSVEYIQRLAPPLKRLVSSAFVQSFVPTNGITLGCGIAAMLMCALLRERRLEKS